MLELKSKNLFTIITASGVFGICKILEFYDLIGKNILYLYNEENHTSTLKSLVKCNKQKFGRSDFKDVLSQHLFRVDIIVVDTNASVQDYLTIIKDVTDLPVIFIMKSISAVNFSYFEKVYVFSTQTSSTNINFRSKPIRELENYLIQDLNEGWESNLYDLKIQYIRDKNLSDLLGDD